MARFVYFLAILIAIVSVAEAIDLSFLSTGRPENWNDEQIDTVFDTARSNPDELQRAFKSNDRSMGDFFNILKGKGKLNAFLALLNPDKKGNGGLLALGTSLLRMGLSSKPNSAASFISSMFGGKPKPNSQQQGSPLNGQGGQGYNGFTSPNGLPPPLQQWGYGGSPSPPGYGRPPPTPQQTGYGVSPPPQHSGYGNIQSYGAPNGGSNGQAYPTSNSREIPTEEAQYYDSNHAYGNYNNLN